MSIRSVLWAASCALACAPSAVAAVIDFESTAVGAVPADNQTVGGAFVVGATSAMFGFDTNGDMLLDTPARFEDRSNGEDTPWVAYTTGTSPVPPLGPDLDFSPTNVGGNWLLREGKAQETGSSSLALGDTFLIVYGGVLPTSCSGEIWDIDGDEQFRVDAFDSVGGLIATYVPPIGILETLPGTRNGLPTAFFFSGLGSPIAKLRISLDPFTVGGGFGFDNFNATEAPAPGALSLLAPGAAVLLRRRRPQS